MDGTIRDILLPWSPQHPGGGAKPGMPAKHSELWGFSSSKFRKRKTWQLDNDDEQEETIMVSVGQLLCGRPMLCTHPHKHYCGSYFCYHYKNKARRESHSQQRFQLPLSPILSISVAGWENLSHLTQLVPAPLGMELKSQGERGVAWIIRVGRHTHLPFQLLA